jgi:hypothetical protein
MPTYDGGYNGRDTTTKKRTAYTITRGATQTRPGVGSGQRQITRSADALQSGSNVQTRQGLSYNNPDASRAFAWDPNRKTYTNLAMETARLGAAPGFAPPAGSLPGGPGGGGGGGGFGGGGGGGGGVDPADYTKYAAAMQQLLKSSLFNAPAAVAAPAAQQNLLKPMIDPAVDKDVANARGAYANIGNQVSMEDPYLALIANQAPQLSADMGQFLASQGMAGGQDNAVALANAQLAAGGQNWQNLARILGQNHLAGQRGVVDTAKLQGENIVQGLEGQRTGLHALSNVQQMQLDQRAQDQALQLQIAQRDAEYQAQQQKAAAIMQLIAAGLPYGQAPDLAGLI